MAPSVYSTNCRNQKQTYSIKSFISEVRYHQLVIIFNKEFDTYKIKILSKFQTLFYIQSIKLNLRFFALSHEEKCAVTMIKSAHFLYNFLKTFHEWNPTLLYHIYQHRKLPNYLPKNNDINSTKLMIQRYCIAWLDEPALYFNVDNLQSQTFFQQLINWTNKVSNNKVLQYAHKIKNKLQPQENLLWFTQKSFQSIESWLVNQIQKAITKNYYNKNNYDLDHYSKIQKLKSGLSTQWNTSYGCKKQLQMLLSMKISDTKNKNQIDYKDFQHKVKIYEDHYYQQVSLLMDYQKDGQDTNQRGQVNKKKKKKSKKRNKKKQSQANGNQQLSQNKKDRDREQGVDNQEQKQQKQDTNMQKQAHNQTQLQLNQTQLPKPLLNNMLKVSEVQTTSRQHLQMQNQQETLQKQEKQIQQIPVIKQSNYNLLDKNQDKKDKRLDQISKQKSGNSDEWSNAQTTKTTKKSGHSHPQFTQIQRGGRQLKSKRSMSKDESHNSISKVKRKNRGQTRHKLNAISSWNGDQSANDNMIQSYEGIQYSPNNRYQTIDKEQSQQPQIKQSQLSQKTQPIQKKKKKKNNKGPNLLKQLSNKVSTSLINRQLNNFIDSLSNQSNSLIDHKMVSFERVRFFIQSLFPTSQAILFGSNAVGLSLPTSDIDIMLFNLPCACRQEAIQILAHLAVQINTMGWIVSCSTYLNAKVPLVKLQIDPTIEYIKPKRKCDYIMAPMLDPRILYHLQLKNTKKQSNKISTYQQKHKNNTTTNTNINTNTNTTNQIIKVDLTININQQGILGGQSTQLMKQWMNRYPQIHMCILAFKYILAQRGFSSNFKGGIGSYCLFVMVAAYIRQYPELEQLDDGQFFLSTLKFYGEDFQNQIKSIILRPFTNTDKNIQSTSTSLSQEEQQQKKSCFISLQQTYQLLKNQMIICYQTQDPTLIYNIQTNPLRLFDPINNRIMSGSCHLYPQIKSQFRRIYKQLQTMKQIVQKQVQLTINGNQIPKMLENKKTLDKWLNKYQGRSRVSIKDIFDGGF